MGQRIPNACIFVVLEEEIKNKTNKNIGKNRPFFNENMTKKDLTQNKCQDTSWQSLLDFKNNEKNHY